ncbi:MAG: ATP-binding cassette domain-containing protein [Actinomycetota bacterium]|nr:ATP-binding cassette domain-containing protein [Actinomycetota bacterium]
MISKISVKDICYRYPSEEKNALKSISAEFETGVFYAIVGKNGSGKSTLARMLNALLIPERGIVTSCGMETANHLNHPEIREKVSMIFEDPETQLVCQTVEEEIAFGPENIGLPVEEIKKRVKDALRLTGIEHLAKRPTGSLSIGEKQLVAIAGALAMNPSFIVSDESTSMLDFESRKRIIELYIKLVQNGIGIIHITHFLEEASLSDCVLVLDDGYIAESGKPIEVLGNPETLMKFSLDPLPVTDVVLELRNLGYEAPHGILSTGELLEWLKC